MPTDRIIKAFIQHITSDSRKEVCLHWNNSLTDDTDSPKVQQEETIEEHY